MLLHIYTHAVTSCKLRAEIACVRCSLFTIARLEQPRLKKSPNEQTRSKLATCQARPDLLISAGVSRVANYLTGIAGKHLHYSYCAALESTKNKQPPKPCISVFTYVSCFTYTTPTLHKLQAQSGDCMCDGLIPRAATHSGVGGGTHRRRTFSS